MRTEISLKTMNYWDGSVAIMNALRDTLIENYSWELFYDGPWQEFTAPGAEDHEELDLFISELEESLPHPWVGFAEDGYYIITDE